MGVDGRQVAQGGDVIRSPFALGITESRRGSVGIMLGLLELEGIDVKLRQGVQDNAALCERIMPLASSSIWSARRKAVSAGR
jgi:hypothetical protein